jgi:hypothetical protein
MEFAKERPKVSRVALTSRCFGKDDARRETHEATSHNPAAINEIGKTETSCEIDRRVSSRRFVARKR